MELSTYKGLIVNDNPQKVFVFGANTQFRHGMGAALVALKQWGAKYGQIGKPWSGQSYAIITKDLNKIQHPSVGELVIESQIEEMYDTARLNPTYEFHVAYTEPSITLNGYTTRALARMFANAGDGDIPENVFFEENFAQLVQRQLDQLQGLPL